MSLVHLSISVSRDRLRPVSYLRGLYVLRDGLDPVATTNYAGTVRERFSYDAFGRVRFLTAAFAAQSGSTAAWDWLFHCEFRDEDTDLYNYGYRWYHAILGRWLSRDPIGIEGGRNLYRFVGNNGVNRWDRLGLASAISSSIKVKGTDYLSRFAIVSQLVSRASNINVDWNVRTTGTCQSDGSITDVKHDKTGKHHGGANVTILKLGYRFTLDGKIDNSGLVRTTKVAGKCCHAWEHEVSIDIEYIFIADTTKINDPRPSVRTVICCTAS